MLVTDVDPPVVPASALIRTPRPGRVDWRPRLRWFAAEILVVVAGVLIALTLNALWDAQQESRREIAYLRQLLADARVNEQVLQQAMVEDSRKQGRNASLLVAFQGSRPPALDSMRAWLQQPHGTYSDPRPRLSTVDALLQTGEVRLLRNAPARAAVIGYGTEMETDLDELSRTVDLLLSGESRIVSRYEAAGLPLRLATADVRYPDAQMRTFVSAYSDRWLALQADPQVRSGLQDLATAYNIRLWYLQVMLTATGDLRRLLESQLAPGLE
jgi:hypothetical protein